MLRRKRSAGGQLLQPSEENSSISTGGARAGSGAAADAFSPPHPPIEQTNPSDIWVRVRASMPMHMRDWPSSLPGARRAGASATHWPAHVPFVHMSPVVFGSLSSHVVPSATGLSLHSPSAGSQYPSRQPSRGSGHVTRAHGSSTTTHSPFMHTWFVSPLRSMHGVPSGNCAPVLHWPSAWSQYVS